MTDPRRDPLPEFPTSEEFRKELGAIRESLEQEVDALERLEAAIRYPEDDPREWR